MRLVDTLQICSITGRSGKIKCKTDSEESSIFLNGGKVTHCEAGDLSGEEGLYKLLSEANLEISFEDGDTSDKNTIQLSLDHILLEAARRKDEKGDTVESKAWARMITVSGAVQQVFLFLQPDIIIGRSQQCDLCIANSTVSNRHAHIKQVGEEAELSDLDSSNGTFLNGQPVKKSKLSHGDQVQFGAAYLRFETKFDSENAQSPGAGPYETTKISLSAKP